MPSHMSDATAQRSPLELPTWSALSAIDQACVAHLIGHPLAVIKREFILQTLRFNQGNRTRAAGMLGISLRSLRDKLRTYRNQGENVPESGSSFPESPMKQSIARFRH